MRSVEYVSRTNGTLFVRLRRLSCGTPSDLSLEEILRCGLQLSRQIGRSSELHIAR